MHHQAQSVTRATTLKAAACADCKNPRVCETLGRWCDVPEEMKELARRAAKAQAESQATEAEIIAAGMRFICDVDFGEYE